MLFIFHLSFLPDFSYFTDLLIVLDDLIIAILFDLFQTLCPYLLASIYELLFLLLFDFVLSITQNQWVFTDLIGVGYFIFHFKLLLSLMFWGIVWRILIWVVFHEILIHLKIGLIQTWVNFLPILMLSYVHFFLLTSRAFIEFLLGLIYCHLIFQSLELLIFRHPFTLPFPFLFIIDFIIIFLYLIFSKELTKLLIGKLVLFIIYSWACCPFETQKSYC